MYSFFGMYLTEKQIKEKYNKEMEKVEKAKQERSHEDAIRRERHICDLVSKDEILDKINHAICLIDKKGNGQKTVALTKSYNARLDEIARVMMKLKK